MIGRKWSYVGLAIVVTAGCRIRREDGATRSAPSAPAALSASGLAAVPSAKPLPVLPPRPTAPPEKVDDAPQGSAAVAFGGLGSDPQETVSVVTAVRLALRALAEDQSPLDAAVAGVRVLEDDPDLNAGIGSAFRVGGTVELDAAVMDSMGHFGAVGSLHDVQHPVDVARAVVDTPHRALVGAGADAFAKWLGVELYDPRTEKSRERYKSLQKEFAKPIVDGGAPLVPESTPWNAEAEQRAGRAWAAFLTPSPPEPVVAPRDAGAPAPASSTPPVSSAVNGPPAPEEKNPVGPSTEKTAQANAPHDAGSDTVAVIVRNGRGAFGAAASTGGPWLAFPGRVSDVVVPGAAIHVGKEGAVAVTGRGERIIDGLIARRIYDRLMVARSPRLTVLWALNRYSSEGDLGVMIVDTHTSFVGSSARMAWAEANPEEKTSAEEDKP